jgi:hypothetical protein
MKFRAGVDNALKAFGKVVRIQQKPHELGQPVDLGVIVVNETIFWLLSALGIRQRVGDRIWP